MLCKCLNVHTPYRLKPPDTLTEGAPSPPVGSTETTSKRTNTTEIAALENESSDCEHQATLCPRTTNLDLHSSLSLARSLSFSHAHANHRKLQPWQLQDKPTGRLRNRRREAEGINRKGMLQLKPPSSLTSRHQPLGTQLLGHPNANHRFLCRSACNIKTTDANARARKQKKMTLGRVHGHAKRGKE